MKTLFLHIGMHKTGTSSLQMTFFRNRDILAKNDVTYLDIEDNHSAAFFSLFSNNPAGYHINRKRGIIGEAAAKAYNEKLLPILEEKLGAITTPFTIISAEDLSLLPRDKVPALKVFLSTYFDHIKVIGYARAPVSFVNSMAVQALKGGATLDSLTETPPKPEYQWRFKKYQDTFGPDHVHLRPFSRATLKNACIVADFLDATGLPASLRGDMKLFDINASLSMTAGLVLDKVNQQVPAMVDGRPNPRRNPNAAAMVVRLDGPAFRLTPDVIDRALAESAWDIRWMEKQLGISDFDDRGQKADTPPPPDLTSDEVTKLLHDLLNH